METGKVFFNQKQKPTSLWGITSSIRLAPVSLPLTLFSIQLICHILHALISYKKCFLKENVV